MKIFIWVIIIAALIFGGYKLLTRTSSEDPQTAQSTPVPEKQEKKLYRKAIKNWKPVKKVQDLSDQHQKDLQENL